MRYFVEVAYQGLDYSGFQIQKNAPTIQSKVTEAFSVLLSEAVHLTGSSRTDAAVNAYQNFFHFDYPGAINTKILYNLNAILPPAIVIKKIIPVREDAHARFSAIYREYIYLVIQEKNPFLYKRAYYYPYKLSYERLAEAAAIIKAQFNFIKFCKSNAQVSSYHCKIMESYWTKEDGVFCYTVKANRFLRGMVKALVGTMLQYAGSKISLETLHALFSEAPNSIISDFSPPGYGLYLKKIGYPEKIFSI
jgi:tRNA pseudouridine38-40 synthase